MSERIVLSIRCEFDSDKIDQVIAQIEAMIDLAMSATELPIERHVISGGVSARLKVTELDPSDPLTESERAYVEETIGGLGDE